MPNADYKHVAAAMSAAMKNPTFQAKILEAETRNLLRGAGVPVASPKRSGGRQKRRNRKNNKNAGGSDGMTFGLKRSRGIDAPVSRGIRSIARPSSSTRLHFRYCPGFLVTGNGTVGAIGSLYYCTSSGVVTTVYTGLPIRPGDSVFGSNAVGDVVKHFGKIKYHKLTLNLRALQATSATGSIAVVWARGGGVVTATTVATPAGPSYQTVSTSQNCTQTSLWDSIIGLNLPIDKSFTNFIGADTSGAAQGLSSSELTSPGTLYFAAAGAGSSQIVTHAVEIDVDCELFDFEGPVWSNITVAQPPVSSSLEVKSELPPVGYSSASHSAAPESWVKVRPLNPDASAFVPASVQGLSPALRSNSQPPNGPRPHA